MELQMIYCGDDLYKIDWCLMCIYKFSIKISFKGYMCDF